MIRSLLALCFLTLLSSFPLNLSAQGCETMTYSYIKLDPCKYRVNVHNQSLDCYQQTNLILDLGEFYSWTANTAEGWIVEEVSPSQLLITHVNGIFPVVDTWVLDFYSDVPPGPDVHLICQYDNTCLMDGCENILGPLDVCPPSCITGIVYRECEENEYIDQPGLENWTVRLFDNMGNFLDEVMTGMDGTYEFCGLNLGEFVVELEVPNGWSANIPANGIHSVSTGSASNPTARFGVCPDCNCDLVDFIIQQEASTTDTSYYDISMFNESNFCFEYLEIDVLQGELIGWDINLPGWTVEEILPGRIHIEPFYPFIEEGVLQNLRVQVVSSDTAHIEVSATYKAKQESKPCKADERFPSPPKNVQITCCPAGTIHGMELVDNGAFGLLTPPASDYIYTVGPLTNGKISIKDQAQAYASNNAWVCPGFSGPADTYLAVDGSTTPGLAAWKQQVNGLLPNTDYVLCAEFNNLVKPNQNLGTPLIELSIQDDIIPANVWTSGPMPLPETPDQWTKLFFAWTAPASPSLSYTLKVGTLDIQQIGNDFAVDNISFMSCAKDPDTCACNTPEMILTQNGIDYPLACTKGVMTTPLPCPADDVLISGFFGCEKASGGPCTESTVNWTISGPNNYTDQGTTTNYPLLNFDVSSVTDPGDYFLTLSTLCPGATDSCVCQTRWIREACDTCHCGGFDHLYLRGPQGAMSQPMTCNGPPITLVCPNPGQGFTLTGNFACEGDSCPDEHLIEWGLTQPDGTVISMSFWDNDPIFGITLLPTYFNQSGVYMLNLTGYCGDDTCTCKLTFILDCPNQCPCDITDILALQDHVDKGFAVSYSNKSCKACFSPLALDKCDQVDWFLTTSSGTSIGSSWGNQTFCYLFPGSGTYTVIMQVTRLKPDGSLCEVFVKSQTVTVTCIVWPNCATSILKNPDFAEDGIPGDIAAGGMGSAPGWIATEGHPTLLEGHPLSADGWAMKLEGNFDQTDILMTEEVYCLSKYDPKGKLKTRIWGDPHVQESDGKKWDFKVKKAYQPIPNPFICEDPNADCYTLASLEDLPPPDEDDWYTVEIPYDFSDWAVTDSCGDGNAGIPVQLATYVWNQLSSDQCACPISYTIYLDNICFEGALVSTDQPWRDEQRLLVFPNPTTGQVQVQLPIAAELGMHLVVLDLMGRPLISQSAAIGERSQSLDLSIYPAGLYFLQWEAQGRLLASERVVKE